METRSIWESSLSVQTASHCESKRYPDDVEQNCEDFWTRGQALDIDYRELYSVPNEGKSSSLAYVRLKLTRSD